VASRQEQKEARRRERLERERKEAAAAARRKRVQLAGGVVLGLAAIAAVVVAITVGFGGGDDSGAQAPEANEQAAAELPPQETSDMEEAAEAAGCQLANPAFEGANHDDQKEFKAADYKTNPPTSGNHHPEWYEDGVYEPDTTPSLGMLVHTLEHGRINIQYKPGTPADTVAQLEALYASEEMNEGYHLLLYQNTTGMEHAVAATAWTHSLTCPRMNDKVFDAIRTFRARYIDKGPETVP
jgi:Protein of unknown function (DUF3105)